MKKLFRMFYSDTKTDLTLTLTDFVEALQKSFSRLSQRTVSNTKDFTAMIIDDVKFEATLRVTQQDDKLYLDKNGPINLVLNGTIDIDLKDNQTDNVLEEE